MNQTPNQTTAPITRIGKIKARLEKAMSTDQRGVWEAKWQESQARKLVEDKARALGLGLSLEAYLEGLGALRQLKRPTAPGHCTICKRTLTLKDSVSRGVGPECARLLAVAEQISAAAQVAQRVEDSK